MFKENVRRTAKILCLFMAVLLMMGMLSISAAATSETIAVVTNTTSTDATLTADQATRETANSTWWNLLGKVALIAIVILCTAIISGYRYYKKEQELRTYYDRSYSNLLRENQALQNLRKATSIELTSAQSRITALEDWRSRAIKNYPEIGNIVRLSYAKDQAEAYHKKYSLLYDARPTYTTYSQFVNAVADYQLLNEDVQMLVVGIDIERFKQKRKSALLDYIKTAKSRLEQTDAMPAGVPREDSLMLARVIEWYDNLPEEVKCEIPSRVITSLKMKKANADYNLEVMIATDDYDVTAENGSNINKLLDSVVAGSSKLFGKATTWVTKKIEDSKKILNDPFENSYYDDDAEFDEDEDDDEGNNCGNADNTDNNSCASDTTSDEHENTNAAGAPDAENSKKTVSFNVGKPGETYTL